MTFAARLLNRPVFPPFATPAYRVRLASGSADVRAAQKLRFLVFNVELSEGLQRSFETCPNAGRQPGVRLRLDESRSGSTCTDVSASCFPRDRSESRSPRAWPAALYELADSPAEEGMGRDTGPTPGKTGLGTPP